MVTASPALPAAAMAALIALKITGEPVDPRERNPDLPREWSETIVRCLAREPENRFESAVEVVRALERKKAARRASVGRWLSYALGGVLLMTGLVWGSTLVRHPVEAELRR